MGGLDLRLTGGDKLKAVSRDLKAAGDKGLGKRMSAGLRAAAKELEPAIRASAQQAMPGGGGYRALLSRSLRFRTDVRASARNASVRLRTYADGARQRRDLPALEAGNLRHPIYGRSRRRRAGGRSPNPWSVTRIEAGFHRRGTQDAATKAEERMGEVLDDVIRELGA